jgi:hypothetical protein
VRARGATQRLTDASPTSLPKVHISGEGYKSDQEREGISPIIRIGIVPISPFLRQTLPVPRMDMNDGKGIPQGMR